jgi:DNA topoisomerase-3
MNSASMDQRYRLKAGGASGEFYQIKTVIIEMTIVIPIAIISKKHSLICRNLRSGDELKISQVHLQENNAQPPKLYSEADLLSVMENAGRTLEDRDEQKAISNIGIGTPATRASIIETLLSRKYIIRKSKALIPAEKGQKVYNLIKDQKIANVQMTAEWGMALDTIEKVELSAKKFISDVKEYTQEITKELLSLSIPQETIPELKCSKCKQQNLLIKDKIIKCPDEQCSWMQFRTVCGVQLSIDHITSLVNNGSTTLIKNMKAKNGKSVAPLLY